MTQKEKPGGKQWEDGSWAEPEKLDVYWLFIIGYTALVVVLLIGATYFFLSDPLQRGKQIEITSTQTDEAEE